MNWRSLAIVKQGSKKTKFDSADRGLVEELPLLLSLCWICAILLLFSVLAGNYVGS